MQLSIARSVSEGVDSAKAGHALETYAGLLPAFTGRQMPVSSHYAFAWIIYYALHQSPDSDVTGRKLMLANYFKLSVAKPHKLHSMILTEAVRLYRNAKELAFTSRSKDAPQFSIVRFMAMWDRANLRPGDWRRKEIDGRLTTSTAEKLITVCTDEFSDSGTRATADFEALADHALTLFPDDHNLLSQRAELHRLAGDNERASQLLRRALLIAPNKYYLWQRLAAMVSPADNPRLHTALLYKALRAPGPDQFKGRVRLALASVMATKGAFAQARWELDRVSDTYTANGWHMPRMASRIEAMIPAGTVPADPTGFYARLEPLADSEIYDAVEPVRVRKNYHKAPRPDDNSGRPGRRLSPVAWRVADATGTNLWLIPSRMGIDPELPMGTELTVRVFNGRIVKAEMCADAPLNKPDRPETICSEPEEPYGLHDALTEIDLDLDGLEHLAQFSL